jgi:hypothetical protein
MVFYDFYKKLIGLICFTQEINNHTHSLYTSGISIHQGLLLNTYEPLSEICQYEYTAKYFGLNYIHDNFYVDVNLYDLEANNGIYEDNQIRRKAYLSEK